MSEVSCIVLAAGAGRRMGHDENKIFIKLGNKSIIQWTLSHIEQVKAVSEVILVVADGEAAYMKQHIASLGLSNQLKLLQVAKSVKILCMQVYKRLAMIWILSSFTMELDL